MSESAVGTFDLHCHPAPDLSPRNQTDEEVAQGCLRSGQRGFVIKSHVGSTADRAVSVRARYPGVEVVGSITLNRPVGGLNAAAVEVAARCGARMVWMPTLDSRAQRAAHDLPPSYAAPVWSGVHQDMAARPGYGPAVTVLDGDRLRPEAHHVLDVVAEYDLALGTGHLDAQEVSVLLAEVRRRRIERVMVTHPDLPRQAIGVDEQKQFARQGALIERCLSAVQGGKVGEQATRERIRACGVSSTVVTTDLGQPGGDLISDGMAVWQRTLARWSFTDAEIESMTSAAPLRLVSP
ncbi:hypothetical protein SUDANB145_06364 [Streptomyces sp. enrichment culture]|uniref:DUF6282 family protein n=1 Tax=Streptomyces sp. enrichment culture TaxID=1795815 RepID=UPI003F545187